MRLETEFRLRSQLMTWVPAWTQNPTRDRSSPDGGDPAIPMPPLLPQSFASAGLWVKLRQAPGPFSSETALLLCELESGQWVAWVPDQGEVTLDPGEFYLDWDEMG